MAVINSNARLYDVDGNPVDSTHPVYTAMASGAIVDVGAKADAAVTDPTADASVIAATKGTNSLLGGLPVTAAHRSAITSVDKLVGLAALPLADMGEGTGQLVHSTTYYARVDAVNRFGFAIQTLTIPTQAMGAGGDTHALQITVAQVTGAVGYHIFVSSDAAPKWVAYITEAQRAAGCAVTAVGTVGAGTVAGKVDVQVAGTGIQTSDASLAYNTAYSIGSITPIVCTGKHTASVMITATLSGNFTVAPVLKWVPAQYDSASSQWVLGAAVSMSLAGASGCSLSQQWDVALQGSQFAVLFDTLTGVSASAVVTVR